MRHVGAEEEKALPALRHRELLVRSVTVQKEGLEEDRDLPVSDEEDQNRNHEPDEGKGGAPGWSSFLCHLGAFAVLRCGMGRAGCGNRGNG